jgi:hypothetical protein
MADALHLVAQHADGHLVGHEPPLGHIGLGLAAQGRIVPHLIAEKVSGGDVVESVMLDESGGLGALAGTGGAEKDEVDHGVGSV